MAVVISNAVIVPAATPNTPPFPLSHARIGYTSVATASNVTASSEQAGFPASAAVNGLTYDQWRPASVPATWTVQLGAAADIDYVGIAGHNLASIGGTATVQVSYNDGSSWSDVASTGPQDNGPIMFLFSTLRTKLLRVRVTAAENDVQIPVIFAGQALVMQRSIYGGVTPPTMARKTVRLPNESDAGQALGESIIRRGVEFSVDWEYLTPDWVRSSLEPFLKATRAGYFFFAWNPGDYPQEVAYGRLTDDPRPVNMGIAGFMRVSMSIRGYTDA